MLLLTTQTPYTYFHPLSKRQACQLKQIKEKWLLFQTACLWVGFVSGNPDAIPRETGVYIWTTVLIDSCFFCWLCSFVSLWNNNKT